MQDKYKFITHFLKLFDTTEDKDKRALQGIVAILTYEEKFDPCFSYLLQNEVNTRGNNFILFSVASILSSSQISTPEYYVEVLLVPDSSQNT